MRLLSRAYRMLLRLWPRGLRDRYGEEAAGLFDQILTDRMARSGWSGGLLYFLRGAAGVVGTAVGARWEALRRGRGAVEEGPNVLRRLAADAWSARHSEGREQGGNRMGLFERLGRDVRFAVRVLRKSPLFTLTATLTLAVGIGANAAIFSMVDAVLIQTLPYPDPDRLALVSTTYRTPEMENTRLSQDGTTWEVLEGSARTVDLAVYSSWATGVNLFADGQAAYVEQQRVGHSFFDVLGSAPHIGREFTAAEDVPGGPPVVVLSHRLWNTTFDSDPGIIGERILLRGEPYTVLGVMPESFESTTEADLWTPLRPSTSGEGGGTNYAIVARLRPGVSWEQAEAEVRARSAVRWEPSQLDEGQEAYLGLVPMKQGMIENVRLTLLVLWGGVGLVLLVVCANLASLILARTGSRSREIGARIALGSGRGAIVRQFLVESLVLAVAGGVLGILLGQVGTYLLSDLAARAIGFWQPVALDPRVLGVTMLVVLFTSVAFGLGPALHISRIDPRDTLVEGGARSVAGSAARWPRRLLVVGEVAVGLLLIVFSGLLVRTFLNLRSIEPGFEPENVVAASISLQDARYDTRASIRQLMEETLERLEQLPSVEQAAVGLGLPFQRPLNLGMQIQLPDGTVTRTAVSTIYVTPGYFETLRVPVLRGRALGRQDGPDAAPVMVVNRAFVDRYMGGEAELGRRVGSSGAEREIVGVVGNVLHDPSGVGQTDDPLAHIPMVYLPAGQVDDSAFVLIHTWFQPSWILRTSLPAEAMIGPVREVIREVDPTLPVARFESMEEVEAAKLADQRFVMTLVGIMGLFAALLAAMGIHGLVAAAVSERTRELGIRLALGATGLRALRAVLQPVFLLVLAGAAVGSVLALFSSRVIESLVWGVSATDPWMIAGGALLLILVTAGASTGPALRVLRLDPARTLREE